MKINKLFCKTFSTIVIVFALALSTNANAASANTLAVSTEAFTLSPKTIALTSGGWFSSFFRSKCRKCGRRHSGRCRGNTHNHGNRCRKCQRRHSGRRCGTKPPTDSIPLDGGLSILMLGAAAFGVRKLRGNKKNDKV